MVWNAYRICCCEKKREWREKVGKMEKKEGKMNK